MSISKYGPRKKSAQIIIVLVDLKKTRHPPILLFLLWSHPFLFEVKLETVALGFIYYITDANSKWMHTIFDSPKVLFGEQSYIHPLRLYEEF